MSITAAATAAKAYDPTTFNHWMHWELACVDAGGEQFQRLFEKVIQRVEPKFIGIRPYGNIGDRKCDGLFFHDSQKVVFQVYSPDEVRQADLMAKINEDLSGALKHWGKGLNEWVFVYNARRGLAPDIPRELERQQRTLKRRYPKLKLDHMSNGTLWEMMRGLSLQQRCEILGPPADLGVAFPLSSSGSADLENGVILLVHDVMSPINILATREAIQGLDPIGPPIVVRPTLAEGWDRAAAFQRALLEDVLLKSRDLVPRFAVFGLSHIPLLVHMGFVLTDRIEVLPFQFHRDRKSWNWDPAAAVVGESRFRVSGLPTTETQQPLDAIVRVSLSAAINRDDTLVAKSPNAIEVDIAVDTPNVSWLQDPRQLTALGVTFRNVLQAIGDRTPRCSAIHLFYAGPAGGAVVIGQAFNPRMNPPMHLYQFDRQQVPRNTRVLTLG
jgi:hypothetical protein